MVALEDALHRVQGATNLHEVVSPPLSMPFLGHNVSQLVKAKHATCETLGGEEADPTLMVSRGVGMSLGSEP